MKTILVGRRGLIMSGRKYGHSWRRGMRYGSHAGWAIRSRHGLRKLWR